MSDQLNGMSGIEGIPSTSGCAVDGGSIRRERDLYQRLLELGQQHDLPPFLRQALALLVEVTRARQGYIELQHDDDAPDQPRWSIAHALSSDQLADVRATRSRGIIAEALATGETICTASALDDPRFKDLGSVRSARIDAVLCAPIGSDPPRGVLYLAGRASGGSFSPQDRDCVELVARHLAPVVDRLLLQERLDDGDDPTRAFRAQLKLDSVVGRGEAMAAVFREVAIAAPSSKTVLLTGQSGTGKTQIARVIHDNSPRAKHPFVEVSCKTLTDNLVENLLFGYKRGAFTGADRDKPGFVAAAEHGTLFLDDIDSMGLDGQAALLQLLQSKQYYPLNQTTPVQADVRFIAGSHVDLQRAADEGRFRQDLLFRLDVITIRLPSLEERGKDIRHLAEHFCAEAWRALGLAPRELSRDALRAIETTKWPGNVRELFHRIDNGVDRARYEGVMQVERRHIFPSRSGCAAAPDRPSTYQDAMREFQGKLIRDALASTEGNVSEAARRLDVARAYLYDLIKVHDIKIERR